MEKDTVSMDMDYEEWYEKYEEELWAAYHEEGADSDQNYEDWCDKRYEDETYCNTCKYKKYAHIGIWCYMFKEKPKPKCLQHTKEDGPAGGSKPN